MLCDECKAREATVHLVSIVNGEKKERALCAACARSLGADSFMPFSWSDMFPSSFGFERPREAVCKTCGMTMSEFKRTGLLGCADCYDALRQGLLPVIARVQPKLVQAGRAPRDFEARKLPAEKPKAEQTEAEKLQEALKAAVAAEEYEKAAELRDRLKTLQEGEKKKEGGDRQ